MAQDAPDQTKYEFDVFISHASEDKESIVRRLVTLLVGYGYQVWYDEFSLSLGDSLRRSIDAGLIKSRFGAVVLSHSFFKKNWPQYELDSLNAISIATGEKRILPIWHEITYREMVGYSPYLADKVSIQSNVSDDDLLVGFIKALGPPPNILRKQSISVTFNGHRIQVCPWCLSPITTSGQYLGYGDSYWEQHCQSCRWADSGVS
ncbi:MAG: toll/interleukin-1 receptor domain-containing protein [Rudaea sp.]|uniref:toll/interleukin-1 receptor domain-containing protein n=1 Tax=unclassified Rudaea TaxID=2627037 RepID=UPI0014851914|nr:MULTISPECIES: toll/interleukin-1 receptor domain-containing protein [unclassified Rudaea]MBN8887552.1 toll/interleukin-1 receptor domain-containing protein [Rudaea sp.]